jgi:hypothetical protein
MAAPATFVRVVQPATINTTSPVINTVPATVVQAPAVQSPIVTMVNPPVTTAPVITPTVPLTTTPITPTTPTLAPTPITTAPATIAPVGNLVQTETLPTPVIPVSPVVLTPARSRVYIIEYSVNLTDLQKSALESKTVLPLITGKNVTIFRVNAENNGVLLEIYFDDGSRYSAAYVWDEAGKSWEKVVPAVSTLPVNKATVNTATEIKPAVLDLSAARTSLSFGRK